MPHLHIFNTINSDLQLPQTEISSLKPSAKQWNIFKDATSLSEAHTKKETFFQAYAS